MTVYLYIMEANTTITKAFFKVGKHIMEDGERFRIQHIAEPNILYCNGYFRNGAPRKHINRFEVTIENDNIKLVKTY